MSNTIAGDGKEYTRLSQFLNVLKSVIVAESVIISDDETDPSLITPTPVTGSRYIVDVGATGDWASHDRKVAVKTLTGWEFLDPSNQLFRVVATNKVMFYEGLYTLNGANNNGTYTELGEFISWITRPEAEELAIENAIIFGG